MFGFEKLFPGVEQAWKCVNLDQEYAALPTFQPHTGLRDVSAQNALLYDVSEGNRVCTYGGFGEDRSRLWSGFEPDHALMIHIGVDFNNLLPGQVVTSLTEGRVVHVLNDPHEFNGWGRRVIIQTGDLYFLYGHLDPRRETVSLGNKVQPGMEIGQLGDGTNNGGWFAHLHVQVMHESFINHSSTVTLDNVDGYVFTQDLALCAGILNPLHFL